MLAVVEGEPRLSLAGDLLPFVWLLLKEAANCRHLRIDQFGQVSIDSDWLLNTERMDACATVGITRHTFTDRLS